MSIRKKILLSIMGLLLVFFLVNQITVYPYMKLLRVVKNSFKEINIGEYSSNIEDINETDSVVLELDDNPSVSFKMYYPDTEESLPLIVYIHGGGWSIGTAESVSPYVKLLASNGYIVANIEYSLSPEVKSPVSTIQINEVINYLYNSSDDYNIDNSNIFIGGNSAGAHLASQMGAIITNNEYSKLINIKSDVMKENLKGLILFNGIYNFETALDCGFPGLDKFLWSYTGNKKFEIGDPDLLSTIKYINKDYPSVFITAGDSDPLEPQTIELINKLKGNDIDYTSILWTGTKANLNHDYMYDLDKDESVEVYNKLIQYLESRK